MTQGKLEKISANKQLLSGITRNNVHLFQDITLISALWALIDMAEPSRRRVSQIRRVPSTEQEAKTSASVGLHCTRPNPFLSSELSY